MKNKGFTTRLVHADRLINQPAHGAVHEPTTNSVLFEFKDVADLVSAFQGKKAAHMYGRSSSGSAAALQNILTNMEQGVGAVTFSTGMAAISATFISLFRAGDHLIVSHFLFGNSRNFLDTFRELGIEITYVDVTDVANVKAAVKENTKGVFLETIANPVTQVADLAAIGQLCAEQGLIYMIDTTMTPSYLFDAKSVGASLTLASLTKYYAGHGNALGGVVVDTGVYDWTKHEYIDARYRVADVNLWGLTQIRKKGLRDMGATLAPEAAHAISVGMETMALRLERTCHNAMQLASYLHNHPKVAKVNYPGLSDHPQHFISREYFKHYGGILSFDLQADVDCLAFLNELELVLAATHLGDTRTLALPVAQTIYYDNGAEQRKTMGISDNMIRMSVGIEDTDDLIADFEQAFAKV